MSEVFLEMTFMKHYEYFEKLQKWLDNFRCLLYAQHVNLLEVENVWRCLDVDVNEQ